MSVFCLPYTLLCLLIICIMLYDKKYLHHYPNQDLHVVWKGVFGGVVIFLNGMHQIVIHLVLIRLLQLFTHKSIDVYGGLG